MTDDCLVIVGAAVATLADDGWGYSAAGAVVIEGGRIAWVGPRDSLPPEWRGTPITDLGGHLLTPGLIDCHTHLIHAGDRHDEFAERATGVTYAEQLARGDGVHATTRATCEASETELFETGIRRSKRLIAQGVTTLEVKSGYGGNVESELKMLRVGRQLGEALPARVTVTLLAGHVYPMGADAEDFVTDVCERLIPEAHTAGLMDAIEVYCEEEGGITLEDASTILETAYRMSIPTRLQTDHLSDSAGAALAPSFYARAAAHVIHVDELGVQALAQAGTIAVLLPLAWIELGGGARPPVSLMRENGVAMAVGSGLNPGTAPFASPLAAAHFAVSCFGLTPLEAFRGVTVNAGRALGLADGVGTLTAGAPADLVLWPVAHPEEVIYGADSVRPLRRWFGGQEEPSAPIAAEVSAGVCGE